MKIYNTDIFEKLKIKPVAINKLSASEDFHDFVVSKPDPTKTKMNSLPYGCICRTKGGMENEQHIWVFVDSVMIHKLIYDEMYDYSGFVRPFDESRYGVAYLCEHDYSDNFPYHITSGCLDIVDIWFTNIQFKKDLDAVCNAKEFKEFYNNYNLDKL